MLPPVVQQLGDGETSESEMLTLLTLIPLGFIGSVLVTISVNLILFYVFLWVLDFNGVMDNPVDGMFGTVLQWFEAAQKLDLIGFPVRFGNVLVENIVTPDPGSDEQSFYTVFFLLMYPIIYQVFSVSSLIGFFTLPFLGFLWLIDKDLFLLETPPADDL